MKPALRVLSLAIVCAAFFGCVRRTVEITSTPPGALVLLNDREVGRTPLTTEILYYGTYDVQLRLEGHEPINGSAEAKAPAWDWIGPDLVAELIPVDFTSRNAWHFTMAPIDLDPAAVLLRKGASVAHDRRGGDDDGRSRVVASRAWARGRSRGCVAG